MAKKVAKKLSRAEAGSLGGIARRKKISVEQRRAIARAGANAVNQALTPEQRAESARKAAQSRWNPAKSAT